MSYSNYGQSQARGGQYNPYAAQSNSNAQQATPYQSQGDYRQQQQGYGQPLAMNGQQGAYGRPNPQQYQNTHYDGGQDNSAYEMGAVNGQAVSQRDPNAILNSCKELDEGINAIDAAIGDLKRLHARALRETGDTSHSDAEIQNLSREIVTSYRGLVDRVKRLRSDPESGSSRNSAQVGRVHRRLKECIQQFQKVESTYSNERKEQVQRAIRIARPDATEEEVQAAAEDPDQGQVFTSALMDRDRRGQAQSALSANKQRHDAIQRIAQEMEVLAQLFQDMDTMVVQQEAAVTNIEQQGEQVEDNVARANVQIDGAITNAKSARKKKFWCLGITLLIIIIIVAVVVAVVVVMQGQNSSNNTTTETQSTDSNSAKLRMLRLRDTNSAKFRMLRLRDTNTIEF